MNLTKLTPELENQILASIRAGAFPHVAAAAWGITTDQWQTWTDPKQKRTKYRTFARKVRQAQAVARLRAEMEAYQGDPMFWLKNGPGKEGPDNPGWTAIVRPMIREGNRTINLFTSPDFVSFMATLRQVLSPYPDALKALADAIDSKPTLALPPPKGDDPCLASANAP